MTLNYMVNGTPVEVKHIDLNSASVNYVVKDGKLVFADSNLYLKGPVNYTLHSSGSVVDGLLQAGSAEIAKASYDIWAQSAFELCWAFITGDTMPDSGTLFSFPRSNGTVNTVGGGYFYKPNNNRLTLSLGYDSNGNSISYGFNLSTNSKYKVKMVKSNGVVTASYSVNGGAFTEIGNDGGDNGTIWPSNYSYWELFTLSNGNLYFDLKETYIKVNGDLWFYGKNYASQNIAPVPSGYSYGTTTTSAIGWVDMKTQAFTAAPSGATLAREE